MAKKKPKKRVRTSKTKRPRHIKSSSKTTIFGTTAYSINKLKDNLTIDHILSFLRPDKTKIIVFLIIIAIHFFLNLGLVYLPISYGIFVSLLYGGFNLPLAIFGFTGIWSFQVNRLDSFGTLFFPLLLHLIYWYVIACFVASVLGQKNKTTKYKYAFTLLLVFFIFIILAFCILAVFFEQLIRYILPTGV